MIDKEKLLNVFKQAVDRAVELNSDKRIAAIKKAADIEDETERNKYLEEQCKEIQGLVPFDDPVTGLAFLLAISDGKIIDKLK